MVILEPITKLRLLTVYMQQRIDRMPEPYMHFTKWLLLRYPEFVPGSYEYYRRLCRNCFYCNQIVEKLTIDHFFPVSLTGESVYREIRVLACVRCNSLKGNAHPDQFIRQFTLANMTGSMMKGFKEKDIKRIADNVNKIFNDVLFNRHKRIYFNDTNRRKLPEYFIKVVKSENHDKK